ncbi:hypothetical protein LR48_Vigan09g077800 [Vigna angularis]|uniref:Putative plant transposon protein domain-containing protein n=1 Tax=Phaseolus angularis TaxID=3914 RepID=A0A0L9VBT5_PHAAN|nr:hypothetical protein LR48_Vigan09g077800 [Vigna angularis]
MERKVGLIPDFAPQFGEKLQNWNWGRLANEIQVCANTINNKSPLLHPSLITHLCELAGVNISAPPFERPRKAIDEAYYKQYCGGDKAAQPVPPRRPHRGRGPPQGQAYAEPQESVLCIPGGHFQRNRTGSVVNIRRTDLNPLAKYWMAFSHANIQPRSHVSDINLRRALHLYCAIRNLNVNIGQLIANEISMCANTANSKAPLGHPSLITHLCKIAEVDTSAPPFERPRKAIDEAYYRKYCGGEEAAQPVRPRRTQRERGQAQSQASTQAHEAKPFQMRDMYMSLIGAQLQAIHRGKVTTAEMIVGMYDTPPPHRWTMEEFHNVVAWPEEQAQGGRVGAAEASAMEMDEDDADDDAFEDAEDEEEEKDTNDSLD